MTLRELCWAAEGRSRQEWGQTSVVLSLIYNANRGREQPAKTPSDFDPHATPTEKPKPPKVGIGVLRGFLGGGN